MYRPDKIISGGQTGADIGGLIGAKRAGIKTGGTAPRGYKTEKGPQIQSLKYLGLVEHPSEHYRHRTQQNVQDADATLIIATSPDSDGTRLTLKFCQDEKRTYLLVDPNADSALQQIIEFIDYENPCVLNVAGNRESKSPGLAAKTSTLTEKALKLPVFRF
mgnify:FL=1